MRRLLSSLALTCLMAQGADWPTPAGNPQREGWAKSETAFTRENVKSLEMLYQYKADSGGLGAPIVNGRLITYLGFKEMLVFGSAAGDVYSVDADLNRRIWKAHLSLHGGSAPNACGANGMPVAMAGSSTAIVARAAVRPPPAPRAALPAGSPPVRRPNRGGEFFVLSPDGYLHILNTSTGEDRAPAIPFLPPNAKVSALNISENVIYAATLDNCGGIPDTVYAIDLSTDDRKVASQPAQEGTFAGSAGTAIGSDGTVYVQARNVHGDRNDTVAALAPRTLEIKDYFMSPNDGATFGQGITPLVFSWKGADVVAVAMSDGRVYLLDAKSLGNPLFRSENTTPGGFHDTFSSWEEPDGRTRWLYASSANGVTGFKVEEREGKPTLVKAWSSAAIDSPSAPVIANGLLFILSKSGLNALDAQTGALLYNSAGLVTGGAQGGLAIANRRIYFAGRDNIIYCFGFSADQPQLTGR